MLKESIFISLQNKKQKVVSKRINIQDEVELQKYKESKNNSVLQKDLNGECQEI